ncbi:hypothetical protein [Acinetobacter lwoffii]|uniref:hypothetical protein n=1 Tax=Acinetobacter lwoffii TaxID=28090 RepID=UPI003BF8F6F2
MSESKKVVKKVSSKSYGLTREKAERISMNLEMLSDEICKLRRKHDYIFKKKYF